MAAATGRVAVTGRAADPRRRRAVRAAMATVLGGIALALAFLLAAWIGSTIPRNGGWEEPADGVTIFVEDNGVHTALVLPAAALGKDWRADFPLADLKADYPPYTHVSISWGQREVFLDTPTWGDLTAATVLRAATGGTALLHVGWLIDPRPRPDRRPLRLRPEEYRRLVAAIERSVLPSADRSHYPGYSWYDAFYDAPGNYTAINTCNQWTSDRLADAGVRTGWWTIFPGGVMKWIGSPERSFDG